MFLATKVDFSSNMLCIIYRFEAHIELYIEQDAEDVEEQLDKRSL